ncbi:MAG: SCP2 sterol-binding domain-containing protein [Candidatus Lokiarchaeota archaeon]|nr:SCP2 sterol-binding domain-containing protein [Candidatus Lokiarchaeota archaeon]
MTDFNEPQDILGIGIRNLLGYRDSRGELEPLIANWEKTVVVEVAGMYPVTLRFHGKEIRIEPSAAAGFDLKVTMSIETMAALSDGSGPLLEFLKGRVKVEKMWHLGTLLRFLKIIVPALRIAGERGAYHGKTHRS